MPETLIGGNFYGSVPEEIMHELNQRMATAYWRDALEQSSGFLHEKKEWFLSPKKVSFIPYLNLKKESVVLDIGAGSGVISAALSHHVKQVMVLEKSDENVAFMKTRFQQDNISNIQVIKGDVLDIPFKDSTFDSVILSGVLEWIPNADINKNPKLLQLKGLKEISRVVKKGGELYIGIENRFYLGYFAGYNDPHCGIPWVTILPRFLAKIYSERKTKKPYVNYLYSSSGYKKILKEAGFINAKVYWAFPTYNEIKQIIPIRRNVLKYYFKNSYLSDYYVKNPNVRQKIKSILKHILPFEMNMHSFIIIANKC